MGRGAASDDVQTASTRRKAKHAPTFLSREKHQATLPESVKWFCETEAIPGRARDVDGHKVLEATRFGLGSDNRLYVVRYRDVSVPDEGVENEAATLYAGHLIASAKDVLNSELAEFGESDTVGAPFEVDGHSVTPRSAAEPYTSDELGGKLKSALGYSATEPLWKVLLRFGLGI